MMQAFTMARTGLDAGSSCPGIIPGAWKNTLTAVAGKLKELFIDL
jgi:hypothetical protein